MLEAPPARRSDVYLVWENPAVFRVPSIVIDRARQDVEVTVAVKIDYRDATCPLSRRCNVELLREVPAAVVPVPGATGLSFRRQEKEAVVAVEVGGRNEKRSGSTCVDVNLGLENPVCVRTEGHSLVENRR